MILGTLLIATPAFAASGPLAVDDQAEAGSDTVQIYVLDNDSDPDGDLDPTSIALITEPAKGNATVIATGKPRVKYTKRPGEAGEDHFTYQVCDTTDRCATATVTVTILGTATTTSTTTTTTTTTLGTDTTSPTVSSTTSPTRITASPTPVTQTTTTAPRTDAAGQAVLSSPTTDTARFGNTQSLGLAAAMATLWENGAETVRIAAVPAVMGAGIAGFLASGLPKDLVASILGWLAGRRRRQRQEDTFKDQGTR